jgi:hypothetical protein
MPNLPAAKALVVVFPLRLAVAPVNSKVPLFPSSMSNSLNASMDARAKAKAATMLVSTLAWMSSGVISRKGFQTLVPAALKRATRRGEEGHRDLMAANALCSAEEV